MVSPETAWTRRQHENLIGNCENSCTGTVLVGSSSCRSGAGWSGVNRAPRLIEIGTREVRWFVPTAQLRGRATAQAFSWAGGLPLWPDPTQHRVQCLSPALSNSQSSKPRFVPILMLRHCCRDLVQKSLCHLHFYQGEIIENDCRVVVEPGLG